MSTARAATAANMALWANLVLSVPIGLVIDRRSRVRFLQWLGLLSLLGTLLTAAAPGSEWERSSWQRSSLRQKRNAAAGA